MKRFLFLYFLVLISLQASLNVQSQPKPIPNSWEQVQKSGKGDIIVYWYESRPFIYQNEEGQMEGIEVEIIQDFADYILDEYNYTLTIHWQSGGSFGQTYGQIKNQSTSGIFGISAFSITADRMKEVDFAPPFMSDISVLISHRDIPIVNSAREFDQIFSKLKAITIEETTYELDLKEIKEERALDFEIRYIPSEENILRKVDATDSSFGFIDLPIYLMEFHRNAALNVKRQNLYPKKREGYAFIYPKGSDWNQPMRAYFRSIRFKSKVEGITGKYLDNEVYQFIENIFLHANDEVMLLTKEKEIQHRELVGKSFEIERAKMFRNFLIGASTIVLISLIIIYSLYQKRAKVNLALNEQKEKIEKQRLDIEAQNLKLERRNQQLIVLNEEKNNLIKILAHDLRTPINHVHGLAQVFLLDNPTLPPDQSAIIYKIIDSAIRLNKMIGKILDIDAIENNRVNIILEEINLADLLAKTIHSFEKQAGKKEISLIWDKPPQDCTVNGDALYLTEIFENLLSNAIKFSPKGKPITITLNLLDNKAIVGVQDQGPGLTVEDQEKLFKKFQRLSAQPTDGEQSTGLGLSIVKKYVELMQGRVWCESEPRKGATFFVELPLA